MSNEEDNNLHGEWKDQPIDDDRIGLLDSWFQSQAWRNICRDADNGDKDSEELMVAISEHLCNLIFHLDNDSPESRVNYELQLFHDAIKDFLDV